MIQFIPHTYYQENKSLRFKILSLIQYFIDLQKKHYLLNIKESISCLQDNLARKYKISVF